MLKYISTYGYGGKRSLPTGANQIRNVEGLMKFKKYHMAIVSVTYCFRTNYPTV